MGEQLTPCAPAGMEMIKVVKKWKMEKIAPPKPTSAKTVPGTLKKLIKRSQI